jgi:hypothetical protein
VASSTGGGWRQYNAAAAPAAATMQMSTKDNSFD